MIVYLIQMTGSDGPPVYYDPSSGKNTGHGIVGWSIHPEAAIGFASPLDAQRFIDALLPRSSNTCRPVPHARNDG